MDRACDACARLAGQPSAVEPHPRLALDRAGALLAGDLGAGTVERWRCLDCASLMLRFVRGPVGGGSGAGVGAWRRVAGESPDGGGGPSDGGGSGDDAPSDGTPVPGTPAGGGTG